MPQIHGFAPNPSMVTRGAAGLATPRWSSTAIAAATTTEEAIGLNNEENEAENSNAVVVDNVVVVDDEDEAFVREPPTTFASLGLTRQVLASIRAQPDWIHPTPIQQLAIPAILAKQDTNNDDGSTSPPASFWCEAPTGSGKTAAFVLPLLQKLLGENVNEAEEEEGAIQALVLCPTRELAAQIGHVLNNLLYNLPPQRRRKQRRVMVLHGGVPLEPQLTELARAVEEPQDWAIDILVATPGRLVDVMTYYNDNDDDVDDEDEEEDDDENNDNYYNQNSKKLKASDAAFKRRLLDALNQQGKNDASLSLEQIEELGLDQQLDVDDGRESIPSLLRGVRYLVVDEADRLLSRAFQNEVDACLDLLSLSHDDTQQQERSSIMNNQKLSAWLFSATFPKQIEPRVDQFLQRLGCAPPLRISCMASDRIQDDDEEGNRLQRRRLLRNDGSSNNRSSSLSLQQVGPSIDFRVIRLEQPKRTLALRRLLENHREEWDRVLVFVATRYAAEHVSRKLRRVGIDSTELHGKLDQDARMRRLKAFARKRRNNGNIMPRVLLATDVASRGLDVVGLSAVVNYDLPRSTADFVHRVGRTGRAGRSGTAVSFVTPPTEAHLELIERRHLPQPMPREVLPGLEPNEDEWIIQSARSHKSVPGTVHSKKGLAHDRMYGGIKGRRKSKKDRLREQAAREAAKNNNNSKNTPLTP